MTYEFKRYLEERIEDLIVKGKDISELALSMTSSIRDGNVGANDLEAIFSIYDGLKELTTLLKAYNDNFHDEDMRKKQEIYDLSQRELRKEISGLLIALGRDDDYKPNF